MDSRDTPCLADKRALLYLSEDSNALAYISGGGGRRAWGGVGGGRAWTRAGAAGVDGGSISDSTRRRRTRDWGALWVGAAGVSGAS